MVRANGRYLNGEMLNGRYLNGVYLNGRYLNGVYLNGTLQHGVTVHEIRVDGSVLVGRRSDGAAVRGAEMVGLVLDGQASDGAPLEVRIDDFAELSPADAERDVFTYAVSARAVGGSWQALCGADASGQAVRSIAMSGRWDYSVGTPTGGSRINDPGALTFACRGAAIAKCVEMGYKPWKTRNICSGGTCSVIPLADHHQACTRMVRADYCGNGRSHTRDGRPINVYDSMGIQTDTNAWLVEAEWDAGGARCVSLERREMLNIPSCYVDRVLDNLVCGSRLHFRTGTLVIDEIQLEILSIPLLR